MKNLRACSKGIVFFAGGLFLLAGCTKEEPIIPFDAPGQQQEGSLASSQEAAERPSPASDQSTQEDVSSRANPFLTQEEESVSQTKDSRHLIDYLDLSAIFYSPTDSKVLIGGRVYKQGDIVDNKEITEITAESVILKDSQGEYIIPLKSIGPGASSQSEERTAIQPGFYRSPSGIGGLSRRMGTRFLKRVS